MQRRSKGVVWVVSKEDEDKKETCQWRVAPRLSSASAACHTAAVSLVMANRGLICRLFGFGFRLNRESLPVLVTCKIMKSTQTEAVAKAGEMAAMHPEEMPIFSHYFMRLLAIDPDLAVPQMPINDAIRIAIEKFYFHYLDQQESEK